MNLLNLENLKKLSCIKKEVKARRSLTRFTKGNTCIHVYLFTEYNAYDLEKPTT